MKKLGKAKIDLDSDLWVVEPGHQRFHMNRRIVETRSDVKKFMAKFRRATNGPRPTRRQPNKREEYFKARDESRRQARLFWSVVYKEVMNDSYEFPIQLRLDRDYDHNSDWRYCLYKGVVYHFDKPGLSDAEMIRQIEDAEPKTISESE